MSIRWAWETIELEKFPPQMQEALRKLEAGRYTVITISFETKLFVKRLTQRAFQLGLDYGTPWLPALASPLKLAGPVVDANGGSYPPEVRHRPMWDGFSGGATEARW